MDKNKTIIIILSIVIVSVAVIGVGIWLLYPKGPQNLAARPAGNAVQYVQGSGTNDAAASTTTTVAAATGTNANPGVVNQQVLIVDGSGPDYHIGPDGKLVKNDGTTQTPVTTVASAAQTSATTTTIRPSSTATTVAVATKNSTHANPATKITATKLPPAASSAGTTKHDHEFWIQVVSSPTRDRVEQTRKDLSSLGFNGRISAFNNAGTDYYRLRYGPYYQHAEADKFLTWVKVIKGLEASYIVEEKAGTAKPAK